MFHWVLNKRVCLCYVLRRLLLRWSAIATHLPKRTDNEIKNYWNTHLKKRLAKMGIDPVTHKPKNDALLSNDGQSKNAANLSHMAQWESARLEAEARLVRESKLRSHAFQQSLSNYASSSSASSSAHLPPRSQLDVLKAWNSGGNGNGGPTSAGINRGDLESPTSTLTFSENAPQIMSTNSIGESSIPAMIEFVGSSGSNSETGIIKEEGGDQQDWKGLGNSLSFSSGLHHHHHDMSMSMDAAGTWTPESLRTSTNNNGQVDHDQVGNNVMTEDGFTNLLLNNSDDRSLSDSGGDSENGCGSGSAGSDDHYYEDNKNYWNSILNLVNSSPTAGSPIF